MNIKNKVYKVIDKKINDKLLNDGIINRYIPFKSNVDWKVYFDFYNQSNMMSYYYIGNPITNTITRKLKTFNLNI